MRDGACKGYACLSVILVLLAQGNRSDGDFNAFLLIGKALYPLKVLPCPISDLLKDTFVSVVCG